MHKYRVNINKEIDSELLNLLSEIEAGEPSKEHLRESVMALHNKLKTLAEN